MPAGTDGVVILSAGGLIVSDNAFVALPLALSVTFTVKLLGPAVPGVPEALITAAFRTAKDAAGQTSGAGGSEWIVFRVTDVSVPPAEAASDEVKKLKDTLQRGLTDEQIAQYVTKIESEIGTSINQAAFAQVTGANN